MATIKDYNYAMNGEPVQPTETYLAEQDIINGLRHANDPVTLTQWVIFKLANKTQSGGVYLPTIDDVVNPDTITDSNKKGSVERMRLLNGIPSVWMKDQKDISPEYVRQNARQLHFARGNGGDRVLRISEHDTAALTFARLCNHNIGSKSRRSGSRFEFYEYDAAREEREASEKQFKSLDAAIEAKQQPLEKMRKHANFLGIPLVNNMGLPKGEDGIRREYIIYAQKHYEYFMKTLGSKEVDISFMVRMAIIDGLIEIDREPGKIYWAKQGGFIGVYAQGVRPDQYLIDLALTNSNEGKQFLDQLQTIK